MARALVTGAGQRIGQTLALCLADQGFDVAVHYASSASGAEQTVAQIMAKGQKAVALQCDLLVEAEVHKLLPQASDALGGSITCLINNASIFEYDTVVSATRESWDRHFESNLRAPFVLMQAMVAQGLAPLRDERGEPVASGLVVNMVDQRVRKLTPEFMTYTLAKSALWTLTQTMAMALAPTIRVNAIGPGPTLKGARQSEENFTAQRAATILGRGADPEGIADALLYFLKARSVTGQLLCVDGGQHLAWQTPDVLDLE